MRAKQHAGAHCRIGDCDAFDAHAFGSTSDATDESDRCQLLRTYVEVNDVSRASHFLSLHPHLVNAPLPPTHETPLHIAARRGAEQMIRMLLSSRADVRALTPNLLRPVDLVLLDDTRGTLANATPSNASVCMLRHLLVCGEPRSQFTDLPLELQCMLLRSGRSSHVTIVNRDTYEYDKKMRRAVIDALTLDDISQILRTWVRSEHNVARMYDLVALRTNKNDVRRAIQLTFFPAHYEAQQVVGYVNSLRCVYHIDMDATTPLDRENLLVLGVAHNGEIHNKQLAIGIRHTSKWNSTNSLYFHILAHLVPLSCFEQLTLEYRVGILRYANLDVPSFLKSMILAIPNVKIVFYTHANSSKHSLIQDTLEFVTKFTLRAKNDRIGMYVYTKDGADRTYS